MKLTGHNQRNHHGEYVRKTKWDAGLLGSKEMDALEKQSRDDLRKLMLGTNRQFAKMFDGPPLTNRALEKLTEQTLGSSAAWRKRWTDFR